MTLEETAKECGLKRSEAAHINSLMDTLSIMSEFYHPSHTSNDGIRYSKIARIERDGGDFSICYISPCLARGKYSIDYKRFEHLKAASTFAPREISRIKRLFKQLELVNSRKNTLHLILQNIVEKQADYFKSGNEKDMAAYSQKEMAKNIGLVPSSICRAITNRSVETLRGRELPLKHFFPRPKKLKMEILKLLLKTTGKFSSDESIRVCLEKKFGAAISRRSVADLRSKLGIKTMRKSKGRGRRII